MYICIDLKSFYASVECVERGLDPLNTNLVVADPSRTEKTICLAVTPSLKSFGIPGRPRLFEVISKIKKVNSERLDLAPNHEFTGSSYIASELQSNSSLQVDYVVAPPQMKHYMEISTKIYEIYLRYIAPEDIHVYSIDEVFIDVTGYLTTYNCTAHELAIMLIREVLKETGITATAGVGTNLYLAKIAMDIVAKKMPADKDGVRIAELDEMSYRRELWSHKPLTDFWRIGKGIAKKLEAKGIYTMGDIARQSENDEDKLYDLFGKNAELLIDHAWGWEPCTISAIKSYVPAKHSISQGQVLTGPTSFETARLICMEMADQLSLDLVRKGFVCDQIVLTVGYDHEGIPEDYEGKTEIDRYGKRLPKQAHSSENIGKSTASSKLIIETTLRLFERIVDDRLKVRRMYVVANNVTKESDVKEESVQFSLFDDTDTVVKNLEEEKYFLEKERKIQQAMIGIKERYGKNAVLKGMNYKEGATAIERNGQVGGHKA